MIFGVFRWWYGRGWGEAVSQITKWPAGIARAFSVSIVFRTLGAPWKAIITVPGKSLDAQLRAFADNLMSRMVGFVVRLFVLFCACLLCLGAALFGIIVAVGWPLLPFLMVFCLVKGVTG